MERKNVMTVSEDIADEVNRYLKEIHQKSLEEYLSKNPQLCWANMWLVGLATHDDESPIHNCALINGPRSAIKDNDPRYTYISLYRSLISDKRDIVTYPCIVDDERYNADKDRYHIFIASASSVERAAILVSKEKHPDATTPSALYNIAIDMFNKWLSARYEGIYKNTPFERERSHDTNAKTFQMIRPEMWARLSPKETFLENRRINQEKMKETSKITGKVSEVEGTLKKSSWIDFGMMFLVGASDRTGFFKEHSCTLVMADNAKESVKCYNHVHNIDPEDVIAIQYIGNINWTDGEKHHRDLIPKDCIVFIFASVFDFDRSTYQNMGAVILPKCLYEKCDTIARAEAESMYVEYTEELINKDKFDEFSRTYDLKLRPFARTRDMKHENYSVCMWEVPDTIWSYSKGE